MARSSNRMIGVAALCGGLALAGCSIHGDTGDGASQMAGTGSGGQAVEPGGDSAAAAMALNQPDEFAWRLFEFLCLQAAPGKAGVAGDRPVTSYDDDKPVVFETWALASGDGPGQTGSEVFKTDGSDPGPWALLPRATDPPKLFSPDLKASPRAVPPGPQTETLSQAIAPGSGGRGAIAPGNPIDEFEVRINQPSFEFIRANTMYNLEGLEALYRLGRAAGNRDFIQFPAAAKEIKADWQPTADPHAISDDEKARFHWRKVGDRYYKLVALHVTTKDLKLWFWADFAQEDYETTQGLGKPVIADPSIDSTTRGPNAPDRGGQDGVRRELMGSKWAHYRLRGAQIDFNSPTVVGNTMIEHENVKSSSCMTCHFRATTGPIVDGKLITLGSVFVTGEPTANLLGQGSDIAFLQTDFEWSASMRAQHKAAP